MPQRLIQLFGRKTRQRDDLLLLDKTNSEIFVRFIASLSFEFEFRGDLRYFPSFRG